MTDVCNVELTDPMPCVWCHLEGRFTERSTCAAANEVAVKPAKHGPRVSHWHCKSCGRTFTVERLMTAGAGS